MIGDAQLLRERKRKAGGVKEMLQEANKLTHRLRFLVEEVWNWHCENTLSDTDARNTVLNQDYFLYFTLF